LAPPPFAALPTAAPQLVEMTSNPSFRSCRAWAGQITNSRIIGLPGRSTRFDVMTTRSAAAGARSCS